MTKDELFFLSSEADTLPSHWKGTWGFHGLLQKNTQFLPGAVGILCYNRKESETGILATRLAVRRNEVSVKGLTRACKDLHDLYYTLTGGNLEADERRDPSKVSGVLFDAGCKAT